MRYNEATINFHQWRDTKIVYGLHFLNNDEAKVFGDVMRTCIDSLNSGSRIDFINNIYDAKENIIPMSEEDICEDFRHEENNLYRDQIRIALQKLFELLSKPTIFSTFMNESCMTTYDNESPLIKVSNYLWKTVK